MSKAKGGLGKGLSALIPSGKGAAGQATERPERPHVPRTGDERGGSVSHLSIGLIRPNPYQPRADFDPQALDELKQSIELKGIIQPITVRRTSDGHYELISGERRFRASTELGLATIPAYIIEVDSDEEMLELALVENLQREHLNPIEIAISYQRLIDEVALSIEDVARKVSKDRTTVTNFLRLLRLPEKIKQSLRTGEISAGFARALLGLPDELSQVKVFERSIKKGLNVRQVERIVRDYGKKRVQRTGGTKIGTQGAAGHLAERMQRILGTRVRIASEDDGSGQVTIEFYSHDDLARIFDLIATIEEH